MYDKNYYNEYVWEYVLPNHLDDLNENNFTEKLTFYDHITHKMFTCA